MSQPVAPSTFDRLLQSIRAIVRAEFPQQTFQGVYEYSIQSSSATTVNCDPVDTSIPLPSLPNVELRPGLLGETVTSPVLPGTKCIVGFINSDPTRPFILSISSPPATAAITAGAQIATEHFVTIEALCVILHNLFFAMSASGLPIAWAATGIIPAAINLALTALATPAPPGLPAQLIAAASMGSSMASAPGITSTLYAANILAALKAKTPDASGLFPSVGVPNLTTG